MEELLVKAQQRAIEWTRRLQTNDTDLDEVIMEAFILYIYQVDNCIKEAQASASFDVLEPFTLNDCPYTRLAKLQTAFNEKYSDDLPPEIADELADILEDFL